MSPTGEIFSNLSYWSMSIEFDKQVNDQKSIMLRVLQELMLIQKEHAGGGLERQRERAAFEMIIICITIQFTRPLQDRFIRILILMKGHGSS